MVRGKRYISSLHFVDEGLTDDISVLSVLGSEHSRAMLIKRHLPTETNTNSIIKQTANLYHTNNNLTMVKDNYSILFEKSLHYALDNAPIIAFPANGTTASAVQKICDEATESYARKILNWPNGRLAKPDIFEIHTGDEKLEGLDDCVELFVDLLQKTLDSAPEPPAQNPAEELPMYPHAFVIVDGRQDELVTMVVAYEIEQGWKVEHCLVPVDVELGMAVESLRFGDITEEEILDQFGDGNRRVDPQDEK
ncbi:hypothetical protein LB507_009295 [Fusarium sp. FIESC RH6]|nr:hypothetical protein LB507_009295 [Fusarium sp. FIESC RH6]